MSSATFDASTHTLTITDSSGNTHSYTAYNNVDSKSKGKWPNGTYTYERKTTHNDDGEDSPYGSHGNVIFTVSGRTDMGVHSGRKNKEDGLKRKGPQHCTMGCIRTTDDGVKKLKDTVGTGFKLTVKNN